MIWIIVGILLVVVLVGAWLYDRTFGFDLSHRDAATFNQAERPRHDAVQHQLRQPRPLGVAGPTS